MLPGVGADFGRYRITERLGRGGMGVVFRAQHRDLQRDVALKLLAPDLAGDETYRHRFVREAQALARLDSPYVITVYDAGEHDGWLFIATELVAGGDLSQRLEDQGPFPIGEALQLVAGAADGLAAAHDSGVLHRDIKPSNLLLKTRPDGGTSAVLCDFGIAALEDQDVTRTQGVIGTPAYLAPERHDGASASVAGDIYAMGCVLWACVSGAAPYLGTPSQVIVGHLHGEVPQLAETGRAEARINRILDLALAKDPQRRFRSATALATAVRATLDELAPEDRSRRAALPGDAADRTTVTDYAPSPPPPAPPPPAWEPDPLAVSTTVPSYASPPPPAPVPAAPPVAVPAPGPRTRSVSGTTVALVLLAAVVVGGAIAGAMLLLDQDDDRAGATTASQNAPTERDRSTPTPTPTPTEPASPTTSATPRGVECWDGSTARNPRGCPRPTGVAGLEWMFPSFDRRDCNRAGHPPTRLTVWQCWTETLSGDPVLIRYNEWQSVASAEASYDAKNRGFDKTLVRGPDGRVVQTIWRYEGVNREHRVTLSVVYRDWPFSVSVEGLSSLAIEDGLDQLVELRDADAVLTR